MDLIQLKIEINKFIKDFPEYSEEIQNLYQLCLDEIEQGESESHEISLCIASIEDLIDENETII